MPVIRKLRYYLSFFPLRINLFLWILLITGLYWRFGHLKDISSVADVTTNLLLKTVLFVTAIIWLGCLLTVVFPWLHYIFSKQNKSSILSYKFSFRKTESPGYIDINIRIQSLWRPLLGTVKLQWWYTDGTVSERMILAGNQRVRNRIFREGIKGNFQLRLPAVREYAIREAVIYFEDGLRLFSLTGSMPFETAFYVGAHPSPLKERTVTPRKTEETKIHIQTIRKTEGDYLHYKDFENHDDVRRIVWKIYARNKELVVRVPELHNPYASHVYVYASFYAATFGNIADEIYDVWLNHYKNAIWSLMKQFQQQELSIRFRPDQDNENIHQVQPDEQLHFQISVADWQHHLPVTKYFQPSNAAVLFFTSLVPYEDMETIISQISEDTLLVFVPLCRLMAMKPGEWWKYIFLRPDAGSLSSAQWKWLRTKKRSVVIENEEKIGKLLAKIDSKILVL